MAIVAALQPNPDDTWTTAQVVLTVVAADSAQAVRATPPGQPEINGAVPAPEGLDHVLWVDDRPNNNTRERRAFEAAGLRFTLALSTNEAMEELSEIRFAVIISDMGRREGPREGYVLLDAIRKAGDQTPLIFYASSNSLDHKEETRRRGGQGCTNSLLELSQLVIESVLTRLAEAGGRPTAETRPANLAELKPLLDRVQAQAGLTSRLSLSPLLHVPRPITIRDAPWQSGPWVTTRERHRLDSTPLFRLGIYLVRNCDYLQFVRVGGYADPANWRPDAPTKTFFCRDGTSHGPSAWGSAEAVPPGLDRHPISGVSFYEADAFCRWLNRSMPRHGWQWRLPTEDMWEYAARCRHGKAPTVYPWGEHFRAGRCNCALEGRGGTSEVGEFDLGNTPDGCADLSGNVWEYVEAPDKPDKCVLRGGSFLNNEQEVRADLRLWGVSLDHRPRDFGFRCALVRTGEK